MKQTSQPEKKVLATVPAKAASAKTRHTWVWVLLIVLFAILVTGGVGAYVLTREISVAVENKIEMPVQANILNTTKKSTQPVKKAPTNAPTTTRTTKPVNTLDNDLPSQ